MKRNPLKDCTTKNNEMICINIQTLFCIVYTYININQKKEPFFDLFCRDLTPPIFIHNWKLLQHTRSMAFGKREEAFSFQCSFFFFFQKDIINHLKNKTNREKPAIGIEPMTIALQMRCSNL